MKYRAFKRTDGFYSITDQDSGQTLDLSLLTQEIADKVCEVLHEVYYEGYDSGLGHGYSNGVAQG